MVQSSSRSKVRDNATKKCRNFEKCRKFVFLFEIRLVVARGRYVVRRCPKCDLTVTRARSNVCLFIIVLRVLRLQWCHIRVARACVRVFAFRVARACVHVSVVARACVCSQVFDVVWCCVCCQQLSQMLPAGFTSRSRGNHG